LYEENGVNLINRPRRNRKSRALRDALAESQVRISSLIQPLFVGDTTRDIEALYDQKVFSLEDLEVFCRERLAHSKIMGVLIFASVDEGLKDSKGSESLNPEGLLPKAVAVVKSACPHLEVMTDVALDPFSSDGHDGLLKDGEILNDETVEVLKEMALVHAKAGADWVAPSDMMDGRVLAIREHLDENGFKNVNILSYTAKYASAFYGPFREALDSAPKQGDKKTYQMDYRNQKEALRELESDELEGADMVMVKPALSYLDVVSKLKEHSHVPVAAYNVSGEYSMVKAAHEKGLIDGDSAQLEIISSIFRAGADVVLTYGALDLEDRLSKN
jgi:porphobilinogen synthase